MNQGFWSLQVKRCIINGCSCHQLGWRKLWVEQVVVGRSEILFCLCWIWDVDYTPNRDLSTQLGKESGRDYNKFGVFLAFIVLKVTREDEITKGLWEEKRSKVWALEHFKEVRKKRKNQQGDWKRTTRELGKPDEHDALEIHQMESM